MREIEFRAYHKGVMLNNCAVINGCLAIEENPVGDNLHVTESGAHFYNDWAKYIAYPSASLMRYTGLKDANGVKIFEGDIMQWHGDESTVAVKWEQATCSYTAFGRLCAMHLKPDEDGDGHLLVIGNIYENPERLHAATTTE